MQSAELHLTKKVKVLKTALQRRGLVAPCVSKLDAEHLKGGNTGNLLDAIAQMKLMRNLR